MYIIHHVNDVRLWVHGHGEGVLLFVFVYNDSCVIDAALYVTCWYVSYLVKSKV